jgi:CheY-like chemotaxis protein
MNFEDDQSADRTPDKPRVLVVDDDRDVLDVVRMFLEYSGFHVTTAADGIEALQVVARGFDVITTDLDMPRMDGREFIRRLHALPIPPIPVVVVTGQGPDAVSGAQMRVCHVIEKPVRLGELARTLRSLLATCRRDRLSCSGCCPGSVWAMTA